VQLYAANINQRDWFEQRQTYPTTGSPIPGLILEATTPLIAASSLPNIQIGLRHWLTLSVSWLAWLLWNKKMLAACLGRIRNFVLPRK